MSLYGSLHALTPGERYVYGTVALAAGVATVVISKLDPGESIKFANAVINSATAPGDSTSVLSVSWTGMTLTVSGWMPISGTDPTLVATTGTGNVSYMAIVGR